MLEQENYNLYHYDDLFHDLIDNGTMYLSTSELNDQNINKYLDGTLNILKDDIENLEDKFNSNMMRIIIKFEDNKTVSLFINDFYINLCFWNVFIKFGDKIHSNDIFFTKHMTVGAIKKYIDMKFIIKYRYIKDFHLLNTDIYSITQNLKKLAPLEPFFGETINIEDLIDLKNENPRVDELLHQHYPDETLEDMNNAINRDFNELSTYITNAEINCMKNPLNSKSGINPKQASELLICAGVKPDGSGGIHSTPMVNSYINGGSNSIYSIDMESSISNQALHMEKQKTGISGYNAQQTSYSCMDTSLYPDPEYICDTKNFQKIYIDDFEKAKLFDQRYFRFNPNEMEHEFFLDRTDENILSKIIGKTVYFRSPMTCASHSKGKGICWRCYGKLAYVNYMLNIGKLAAEILTAQLTQMNLSAKHIIVGRAIKIEWSDIFESMFDIDQDRIIIKSNKNIKDYIIRLSNISYDNEIDDSINTAYVTSADIIDPNGNVYTLESKNIDMNLYISPDVMKYINSIEPNIDDEDNVYYDLDMSQIPNNNIFNINIKNIELSHTLNRIIQLIDKISEISKYDKDELLEELIKTCIEGHININSVHLEVILSNQLKDVDDDTMKPDWSRINQKYKIVTLKGALSKSPIAVRLQAKNAALVLNDPSSSKMTTPSILDVFYMSNPKKELNDYYDIE